MKYGGKGSQKWKVRGGTSGVRRKEGGKSKKWKENKIVEEDDNRRKMQRLNERKPGVNTEEIKIKIEIKDDFGRTDEGETRKTSEAPIYEAVPAKGHTYS